MSVHFSSKTDIRETAMNEERYIRLCYDIKSNQSATVKTQYLYKKTGWRWLFALLLCKPRQEWITQQEVREE